jgi:RNA polymerase sigma-70 factor, ECF subfamily
VTDGNQGDWLAERFEGHRTHLRAVAFRMLGSAHAADDAVQEAWLRASRAGAAGVDNLGGWLTTIVARVCLDVLRARKSLREEPLGAHDPPAAGRPGGATGPEQEALLADSVGRALLVVLETLAPAERVAFVLHDMFDLSFDEIAPIVGRNATAARQLASRARRRVRGSARPPASDAARRREIVDAFLAAARGGDLAALLAVLDPDVVVRADTTAVRLGAAPEVRGAAAVAQTFLGRAQAARRAVVGGEAGVTWAPGGRPRVVFSFTIANGRIVAIDLQGDEGRIAQLAVVILAD